MYRIDFTSDAKKDLKKLISNKPVMEKLLKLLKELEEHPRLGTGQIEMMKHYETETWSRRLDKKNRIVYSIDDELLIVSILSLSGHYEDK